MKRTRIVMLLLVVLSISLLLVIGCNNPKVEEKKDEVIGTEKPDDKGTVEEPDDKEVVEKPEEPKDNDGPGETKDPVQLTELGEFDSMTIPIDEDVEKIIFVDENVMLVQLSEDDDSYPDAWADKDELQEPHYKGVLVYEENSEDFLEISLGLQRGRDVFSDRVEIDPNKGIYLLEVKDQTKRYKVNIVSERNDGIKIFAWSYSAPELEYEKVSKVTGEVRVHDDEKFIVHNDVTVTDAITLNDRKWDEGSLNNSTLGLLVYTCNVFVEEDTTVSGFIVVRRSDGLLTVEEKLFKPMKNVYVELDGDPENYYTALFIETYYYDFAILGWLIDD